MKKRHYLPILIISVFLLLCACAQNVTDQPETTPSSSVQPSSKPTSKPTSTPTIIPTVVTQPTTTPTQPTTAPTQPTTKPTTVPTEPAGPIQLSTAWVTDREIVPFEDRFKEDVPFGTSTDVWLAPREDGSYERYFFAKKLQSNSKWPAVAQSIDGTRTIIYEVVSERDFSDFAVRTADGRWSYLSSDCELIRLDLLTGECTTLAKKNEDSIFWVVRACGKDTACIFELGSEYNLRVFYHDLHSEAEKVIFEGTIPAMPIIDREFSRPTSTLGTFSWDMMNPDFYAAVLEELQNPDSRFKTMLDGRYSRYWNDPYWNDPQEVIVSIFNSWSSCQVWEEELGIGSMIRYSYDPKTEKLTEDVGLCGYCCTFSDWGHNHYSYENTKECTFETVNSTPIAVPNLIKLTAEQAEVALQEERNKYVWDNQSTYSDFGYGRPYWKEGNVYTLLADIAVTDMVATADYVYCVTPDNAIVQLSHDGAICNTVYTSNKALRNIWYHKGSVYFIEDNTLIRINTIEGTCNALIKSDAEEFYLTGSYMGGLDLMLRQGLFCEGYVFDPDTGIWDQYPWL